MSRQESSNDNVRVYLREIGRYPLLTHSQEVVYGKQVHELMFLLEAKEALILDLGREPTLSEWAEHVRMNSTEFHSALQQGKEAKLRMVESNLRLVVLIALNYQATRFGTVRFAPGRSNGFTESSREIRPV